jgi:hypothetical protein
MSDRVFLTNKQTADILGIHTTTLCIMRRKGLGPTWIPVTRNNVKYDQEDVWAWLDAHKVKTGPAPELELSEALTV